MTTKVDFDRIPEELKAISQWVLWKTVIRDGKPTKLPFQINGSAAKSNDPDTWATFEQVRQRYVIGIWDGIGFVFSADDPYCGIDLDSCRNPATGEISDWAREIIVGLESYAEVSPSDTGVKIWIRGEWNHNGNKQQIPVESENEKKPAIEVYDRGRFFCMTGMRLQGMKVIEDRQQQLDAIYEAFFVAKPVTPKTDFRSATAVVDRARKYVAKMPIAITGQNGSGAAFRVACVLILGFALSDSEAMSVMQEWNSSCQPPWSERELQHKISDAGKQSGERGYLRNVSPQNYDKVNVPDYQPPPIKPEIRITTLHDAAKKYVDSIRDGKERIIELGLPELNYAISGGAEPGELFLLAARPSHGKSAVALQMVHHWTAEGIPCAFVSEEMSAIALGKRTVQFASNVPQEHWYSRITALDSDVDEHFRNRATCVVIESCKTSEAAAEAIRKAKREHDIRCAVVDYAQLLGSPGKSRYEQVTNTSICLRQVTSETQVLLIALCQLNRQIETRTKFIPQSSDLKDSGQLEQDADVVVFSVWPHKIDSKKDPKEYQFFISKNRNRGINESFVTCRFEPSRQRFVDDKQNVRESYQYQNPFDNGGDF